MTDTQKLYVWNGFIRFFHFSLIAGIIGEYVSAELNAKDLHAYIGYFLAVMIVLRIFHALTGKGYARLGALRFRPSECFGYMYSLVRRTPKHYDGHNPAGAYMIIALILLMSAVLLSGVAVYAYVDYSGPAAMLSSYFPDGFSKLFKETHEVLFNILMVFIGLHIAGSLISSLIHRENLIKPMITGYKLKRKIHK